MPVISTYDIDNTHQAIDVKVTYDYKPTVDEYAMSYSFLNCIFRNAPGTVLQRIESDLPPLIRRKYAFHISKATANVKYEDTATWQASIHLDWCILTTQRRYDTAWDVEHFLSAIVSPFIQISQPDQVTSILSDLVSGTVSLRDILACSTIAVGLRNTPVEACVWEYYFPSLPDTPYESILEHFDELLVNVKNQQNVVIRFYINDTETDPQMSFQSIVRSYLNMFFSGNVSSLICNLPYTLGDEKLIPITVVSNRNS